MELHPADLGATFAVKVLEERVALYQSSRRGGRLRQAFARTSAADKTGKPHLSAWGRLITRGSGMDDATAARVASTVSPIARGMLAGAVASTAGFIAPITILASQGQWVGVAAFSAMIAAMSSLFIGMPIGLARRWIGTPLSDTEIDQLANGAATPLRRAFGALLRDVAAHDDIPQEAQEGLREAIRALGEAIERLPPVLPDAAANAAQLQQSAVAVRARADAETDPVTQASLSRQADALERSAASATRSGLLLKRSAALHDELTAQIEALRIGLTAFYTGNADTGNLAALSENVRTVAAEATSVASARAELDTLSSSPVPLVAGQRGG